MRQSYRLIWNTVITWILRVFRLIPEIIFLPFLVHRIEETQFGFYVLAWSIAPIFDLLQSGLSVGVIKYCAAYFEKKDYANINKTLSSTCVLLTLMGVVGLATILAVLYAFPGSLEGIAADDAPLFRVAILSVSIMLAGSFPLLPYTGVLLSLQRYDLFNFVKTGFVYVRVFGVIGFFLVFGASFKGLMVISAATYVLSNMVIVVMVRRLVPQLRFHIGYWDRRVVKMMLGFGSLVFLWSVCRVINVTGVRWMMGILATPAFVGVLAIMLKPAELMKQVIQAMSLTITPATSKYASLNNSHMLKELLVRSSRYITLVVSIVMMTLALTARPVLGVWMGADYQYLSGYVIVLSAGMSVLMSASAAHHMLEGMGLLRASFLSALIGLVIVTIALIWLIFGLTGNAFWATVLGLTVGQLVTAGIQIGVMLRSLGISVQRFLWDVYGYVVVLCLPIAGIIHYYCLHNSIDSLLGRLAAAVMSIVIFIVLFLLFFLTKKEKKMVKDILSLMKRRIVSNRNSHDSIANTP